MVSVLTGKRGVGKLLSYLKQYYSRSDGKDYNKCQNWCAFNGLSAWEMFETFEYGKYKNLVCDDRKKQMIKGSMLLGFGYWKRFRFRRFYAFLGAQSSKGPLNLYKSQHVELSRIFLKRWGTERNSAVLPCAVHGRHEGVYERNWR